MSVTVNVRREVEKYGVPKREHWTVHFEDGSVEYDVRLKPEEGSKSDMVEKNVPTYGVPDEVVREVERQLEHALTLEVDDGS